MRVIAGTLRGRTLQAPPGDATRPTGARVKEALFSILGDVTGERVLDLYAGSGALGIEALSRGAASAVFVEVARPALTYLRKNLASLTLEGCSVALSVRAEVAQAQLEKYAPFELVLCDPPWKAVPEALAVLEGLSKRGLFSANARVVLEHASKDPVVIDAGSPLRMLDSRRWGDTSVTFFEPAGAPAGDEPLS